MIAEHLDHPTVVVPAPGCINHPEHGTNCDRENTKGRGPNSFNHRTRNDRRRRPRKEQEGRPEDHHDVVLHIDRHDGIPRQCQGISSVVSIEDQARSLENIGAIGKRPIDPPAEEEKGHRHQRDQDRVLHQGMKMILVAGCTHLIHTEPNVNQEHQHHRNPVIEFGEDGVQGT